MATRCARRGLCGDPLRPAWTMRRPAAPGVDYAATRCARLRRVGGRRGRAGDRH
ncbi:hypothetical protein OCO_30490 [Mycobacterium intracellulare MOTT-02]|uniref:Uncharacterized protein n=1 Tax=Mycobacterium intracellulare (strain ATCC 13950 / DSM 43223 / JCM 6384 / NCTC 13025 / 3600) TaxID=487521 RepID=H8IRD8_MYCIA|nr:hypothetical protein OCU_30400 [Mycobacterium intracellulare ATCC 13950]AFC49412.1 hypothetical protein OCO_30490 [Mycobacterium intracellulare MOTT-02]ETZ35133.1 hypothetical protein L843_3328 [Mycobacterium intracellulare MIN_061107_1834]